MLNPDGVIIGNYRCSLAGRDLNRNYRSKLKDSYPTVWHTKAMVRKSVKFKINTFMYMYMIVFYTHCTQDIGE